MQRSSTNSRSMSIQLTKRYLRELYTISKTFYKDLVVKGDRAETLIVRFNMMKYMAKEVLGSLLKVSYLDEQREYVSIAELLDDIYLTIRKTGIKKIVRKCDDFVQCKFTALYDALGMIDERLKTVRVVRHRVYNDAHKHSHPRSEMKGTEAKATESKIHMSIDPKKFNEIRDNIFTNLHKLDDLNCKSMNLDSFDKKLEVVRTIYEYIIEHIVDICTHRVFRIYTSTGFSFMQMCIRKCIPLIESINHHYDIFRRNVTRIDPEIRRNKKTTIDLIETAQNMLVYYYKNYVFELESLEQTIQV